MGSIKKQEKALFIQRLGAYLIDIVIVSFVATLISMPFIDSEKEEKQQKQVQEIMELYQKQEISIEDFSYQISDAYYHIARLSGVNSLIVITFNLLYFVIYQLFNKGQTIGKRLFKIRVVSDEGELTANQMLIRSFIANSILLEIIAFVFMLFSKKDAYFVSVSFVNGIQYIVTFISIIMIMSKKDGRAIHDKLIKTTVVRE